MSRGRGRRGVDGQEEEGKKREGGEGRGMSKRVRRGKKKEEEGKVERMVTRMVTRGMRKEEAKK